METHKLSTALYIEPFMVSPALKHPPSSPLSPVSSVLSASERRAWTWWLWDGTETGMDTDVEADVQSGVSSVGTVMRRVW